jgi:hypothetical protein
LTAVRRRVVGVVVMGSILSGGCDRLGLKGWADSQIGGFFDGAALLAVTGAPIDLDHGALFEHLFYDALATSAVVALDSVDDF